MEIIILIGLLTVFVTIGIVVLRKDIDKLQQILKEKEMADICHYINNEVYVRTKNCKIPVHRAHVVRLSDTNEYKIIIDLE
jgi:hypothetical protein